jgi:cysteine desulfurase/selenocysteine lyase
MAVTTVKSTRTPKAPAPPAPAFSPDDIRGDFPILQITSHGRRLAYLDNAATSQKPQAVIAAMTRFYNSQNANIHRGVYELSTQATAAYEIARDRVRQFINAADVREIVFVRGATEAINLVAASWGGTNVRSGDEIILSTLEHHSNIVPWQMLAQRVGAVLRVIPINDAGELCLEQYEKLLNPRTRLVAITHVSNALGTINPVRQMVRLAHAAGALALVDGAQSVPHLPIDVRAIDCDFFVFSGHKICGPTGIGVLYARQPILQAMPPYQGGGDMIETVTFDQTTYAPAPQKFEAGTPNISGALGLAAALDYITGIGLDRIGGYERQLLLYAQEKLTRIKGLKIVGTAADKAAVISFVLSYAHPHDVGTILDGQGVAIRTGHHCCQPVMDRYGIPATARASLAFYNTREDVDQLVLGLEKVKEVFH